MPDSSDFILPPQYQPIAPAVNALLAETQAALTRTASDKTLLEEAYAKLITVTIITEADRHWFLIGLLSLQSSYVDCLPPDQRGNAQAQLENTALAFSLLCADDAIYHRIRTVIKNLATAIHSGEEVSVAVQAAEDAVNALTPLLGNDPLKLAEKAHIRVFALQQAASWLADNTIYNYPDSVLLSTIYSLGTYLDTHGFDHTKILEAFARIQQHQQTQPEEAEIYCGALLMIYGLGLLQYPDAAPCMEELEHTLSAFLSQTLNEEEPAETLVTTGESSLSHRIEAALTHMRALIEKDGFSLYSFQQAIIEFQKLSIDSDEEYTLFKDGMMRMYNLGIVYGDDAAKASFTAAKEVYLEGEAFIEQHPDPLSMDEVMAKSYQVMHDMKQRLSNGELPDGAISRAYASMSFMLRLVDYDKVSMEEIKEFFTLFSVKLFKAITPYVPEDKKALFQETYKFMQAIPEALSDAESDTHEAIQLKHFEDKLDNLLTLPYDTPENGDSLMQGAVNQFLDLLPSLANRFILLDLMNDSYDQKEFERLKSELDDTFKLLQFSYTWEQFIGHQKMSLRRMALDLSRFERRRHVMLACPVFPAHAVVTDPNRIFYAGGETVYTALETACTQLGITFSTNHSITTALHARWNQLRESALAVFDYTGYTPLSADATVVYAHGSPEETALLKAASPIAAVAYENGWAYALGKPHLVVGNHGQPMPFDIDLLPVRMHHDASDAERLMQGIQVAMYGVNRNTKGSCIDETAAYMQQAFGTVDDEHVQSLMQTLDDTRDAMRFFHTVEAVLERVDAENNLLITPAFPGAYPQPEGRKVFHITAFRPWSKPLENMLRNLCETDAMEYAIGYEQLNPDILPDIWKNISEATHVVADITNLNPNAVLELAMAQVLGRPTLILTQNSNAHLHLPALQKLRLHTYTPEDAPALLELINEFLG